MYEYSEQEELDFWAEKYVWCDVCEMELTQPDCCYGENLNCPYYEMNKLGEYE